MSDEFFKLVRDDIVPLARSERLRAFYKYWSSLAKDDVPTRDMIDPADIKSLLSHVMLVELEENPFRVRYRLVGTEVVRYTGLDFTGRYLDELRMDDFSEVEIMKAYQAMQAARRPVVGSGRFEIERKQLLFTEFLICPLRTDGPKIDKAIIIEDYVLSSGIYVNELPRAQIIKD
jgi:hypothetical protein